MEAQFPGAQGAPLEEWQRTEAQEHAHDAFSCGKAVLWPNGIGARREVIGYKV